MTDPRALRPPIAEAYAATVATVLEGGIVDRELKALCFRYLAENDHVVLHAADPDVFDERERAALAWAHAVAWDADTADDALWKRLHERSASRSWSSWATRSRSSSGSCTGSARSRSDRRAEPRPDVGDDRVGVRHERVLERRGVRDRRLVGGDDPGVVEVVERVLGDRAEQAGRPAAGARPLLDDEQAVRLARPTRRTVSTSSGRSVRRSTTSASIPSPASCSAAASASRTPLPIETIVRSSPARATRAWPSAIASPARRPRP